MFDVVLIHSGVFPPRELTAIFFSLTLHLFCIVLTALPMLGTCTADHSRNYHGRFFSQAIELLVCVKAQGIRCERTAVA